MLKKELPAIRPRQTERRRFKKKKRDLSVNCKKRKQRKNALLSRLQPRIRSSHLRRLPRNQLRPRTNPKSLHLTTLLPLWWMLKLECSACLKLLFYLQSVSLSNKCKWLKVRSILLLCNNLFNKPWWTHTNSCSTINRWPSTTKACSLSKWLSSSNRWWAKMVEWTTLLTTLCGHIWLVLVDLTWWWHRWWARAKALQINHLVWCLHLACTAQVRVCPTQVASWVASLTSRTKDRANHTVMTNEQVGRHLTVSYCSGILCVNLLMFVDRPWKMWILSQQLTKSKQRKADMVAGLFWNVLTLLVLIS